MSKVYPIYHAIEIVQLHELLGTIEEMKRDYENARYIFDTEEKDEYFSDIMSEIEQAKESSITIFWRLWKINLQNLTIILVSISQKTQIGAVLSQ